MPLIVANFILGMGVGTTKRGRILNFTYSLLCLMIYVIVTILSTQYMNDYILHKANDLGTTTFDAIFFANIGLTFCLVFCAWWKGKHLQTAIMRIVMCEKSMEQMAIEKNYRKLYLSQIYSFVYIIIVIIIFVAVTYEGSFIEETPLHIKFILGIGMNYPVGLLYVSDASFLHWVRYRNLVYSKMRFEQMNNLLQRMLTTTPDSPQHKRVLKMKDEWNKTVTSSAHDRKNRENTDTMRSVKQVHLELIKSIRSINEAYGIQILLSMTISFVFITSLLYYAYSILWSSKISSDVYRQEMVPVVCWVLFYASKVLIINHTCAMATIEAANTGDIICELYEPSASKEFRAEIRDFTLQLIQNPLIFTACGFFNLDHTFIHGVIGSVTTYLVILIQVGDLSPDENKNSTISQHNDTNLTLSSTVTSLTALDP
ncbi:putative gustatory receptor 28b [Pseudomyrmex gracilis]|uniref:putative gustatory receptor 28b n=1 Tax=Pseudomyrmex gracilis TaxID=219809 RepID=UPI000995CB4C|nr:putative gustatory receptor 28b [Pseudomyrmex gracilis]